MPETKNLLSAANMVIGVVVIAVGAYVGLLTLKVDKKDFDIHKNEFKQYVKEERATIGKVHDSLQDLKVEQRAMAVNLEYIKEALDKK